MLLHMFWHDCEGGRALPALPQYALEMAVKHSGCEVWMWSYTGFSSTPQSSHHKEASEILPEDEFRTHLRHGVHVAHLSDLIRFRILARHGGWWVDMDCAVLHKLPRLEYAFQSIVRKRTSIMAPRPQFEDDAVGLLNIAIMKVPPGAAIMRTMADVVAGSLTSLRNGAGDRKTKLWNRTTRRMVDEVKRAGLHMHVARPVVFYMPREFPCEGGRVWFGANLPGREDVATSTLILDLAMLKVKYCQGLDLVRATDKFIATIHGR